jgi:hypothetical protein
MDDLTITDVDGDTLTVEKSYGSSDSLAYFSTNISGAYVTRKEAAKIIRLLAKLLAADE